jgi:hypothetical protein
MLAAAEVMDLQCKIDKTIKDLPWEERKKEFKKLEAQYIELVAVAGIDKGKKGIEWVKTDKDTPAFITRI